LKTEKRFERPVDMLDELKKYFAQSRVFRDNMSTYWRTVYLGEDQIIIPKIRFNIETNYPQFENKSFVVNHANYIIAQSYQRIAFNMDEKGVTFESVVKVEIFGTNDVEEEKTVPKKLIFDKPFYIILRKNNATVPYFIAYIQNPELMILE
jgi:serine protease inhibitor